MNLPTVTLIIPTIGRPRYIGDTVRSVLAQDYPNLRVLISDNAPATPTADVLREQGIADARIRIVSRAVRLGFTEHMNACLAEADGEFAMILSDDDQLGRGYVSEMVALFERDPAVAVAFGRQRIIGEQDTGLLDPPPSPEPAQVFDGPAYLRDTLAGTLRTEVVTYISLFARRARLLEIGAFRPYADGSHADNFILFQLALGGRVALGAQRMLYRVYATSHGLGTPFSALLDATLAYSRDCAAALQAAGGVPAAQKHTMLRRLKRNNFRMLRGRIRGVYRRRDTPAMLASHVLAALRFALTPVSRL